jgi:hypothetical protein
MKSHACSYENFAFIPSILQGENYKQSQFVLKETSFVTFIKEITSVKKKTTLVPCQKSKKLNIFLSPAYFSPWRICLINIDMDYLLDFYYFSFFSSSSF